MSSAEVLSCILKHKKVVICLIEKIHALDKLFSGMNYNTIDREFNANESTMYTKEGVVKQKH